MEQSHSEPVKKNSSPQPFAETSLSSSPVLKKLRELCAINSRLGNTLVKHHDSTLMEYLQEVVPTAKLANDLLSAQMLMDAIRSLLQERGQQNILPAVQESLNQYPIIQQADHSGVVLGEKNLLNNLLFHAALRNVSAPALVTMQCDVVKCFSRLNPPAGPCLLNIGRDQFNIFQESKKTLKTTSVFTLSPARIKFAPVQGTENQAQAPEVLRDFDGRLFSSASDAFREINETLWERFKIAGKRPIVFFDETLSSRILMNHLRSGEGPVYRLFSDYECLKQFIITKNEVINSAINLNLNSPRPDLFMYSRKGRAASARIDFSTSVPSFVDANTSEALGILATPSEIIKGLKTRFLVPDQFLGYVVRSILPGVIALGGTSQHDYMTAFHLTVLKADQKASFLSQRERATICAFDASRLGGAALVQDLSQFQNELIYAQTFLDGTPLENLLLQSTLGNLLGSGDRLEYLLADVVAYRDRWGDDVSLPNYPL